MIPQLFKKKFKQYIDRRGRENLPITFHWRRLYVLPSKPGLFFALIWLVMMMAGLNFNNNMSLMLVFLLFGLAQVVLYRTFFNLKNVTIEQVAAKPVFLGEEILMEITVAADNPKWQISVQNEMGMDSCDVLKQSALLQQKLHSKTRGWQPAPRIKVFTRFPIGLFTVWAYTTPDADLLVYPKPEKPCPNFPQHGGADGEKTTPIKGEELSGIRAYKQGDPIRDIAWKKSAQSNQTWVKEFNQMEGKNLLFDFSQIENGHMEFKLSRMTAWVLEAEKQQAEYRIILPGFDSGLDSGDAHKHHCLKALALFGQGADS